MWKLLIILLFLVPFVYGEDIPFNSTYKHYGFYPSENMFINHDGLRYQLTERDGVRVMDQIGRTIMNYGIGLTATYGNQTLIVTEEDYDWTWTHTTRNEYFSQLELTGEQPPNDVAEINYTYVVHTFTRNNNDHNLNWTEVYEFAPRGNAKITHILTNGWRNVSGATFYYILKNPKIVNYNGNRYNLTNAEVDVSGNFNHILPDVVFPFGTFLYEDLLNDNFDLTNVYIGNADRLGYANKRIMALGFSKGGGNFNLGQTVVLDPASTGFQSPIGHSDPSNQWNNPSNILTSNNAWADESTANHELYTDYSGFSLDPISNITGIEIRWEGHGYSGFCPIKANAKLRTYIDLHNGTDESPLSILDTFGCVTVHFDQFIVYGNSTFRWGYNRSILGTDMTAEHFRVKGEHSTGSNAQSWMDQVKVNVYWELPPPSLSGNYPTPSDDSTVSSTVIFNLSANQPLNKAVLWTNYTGEFQNISLSLYNGSRNALLILDGEEQGLINQSSFWMVVIADSGGLDGYYTLDNMTAETNDPTLVATAPVNNSQLFWYDVQFNATNTDNDNDYIDALYIWDFNGTINERNYFYFDERVFNNTHTTYNNSLGNLNALDPHLYRYFKMDGLRKFGENSSDTGIIITNLRSFDNNYSIYSDRGAGHTPDFITTDCKTQGCLEFDGTSDAIVLEDTPVLEFTSIIDNLNFTMGGWFQKDDTSTMVAVAKGNTITRFFQWRINSFLIYNGSGGTDWSCNAITISPTPNVWQHYTAVANGSGILWYINGNFTEFDSCGKGINRSAWEQDNTHELYLGAGGGTGADLEFDGVMDEVFIYNRSITATEVQNIYNMSREHYNYTIRIWDRPTPFDYSYSFDTTLQCDYTCEGQTISIPMACNDYILDLKGADTITFNNNVISGGVLTREGCYAHFLGSADIFN